MQGGMGDSYGRAAMDFEFVPTSPDRWVGETVARRRQRRLSSPSLRTFLSPAFDAVAREEGGVSEYSSTSSGGLDLAFDASLLRYRRSCFDATAGLESRILRFSPQSAPPMPPPPPPQVRMTYPVAEDGIWAPGGYHYGTKLEAGGRLTATPVFHDFEGISFMSPRQTLADQLTPAGCATNSIKKPVEIQEGFVQGTKVELSTPKSEVKTLSEQPGPNEEKDDDLITEALYGNGGKSRLPIFMEICRESE